MLGRLLASRYGTVVLLAVIMAALPLIAPSAFYLRVGALVWIFALACLGLTVLMGYAGQISLGHAGFMGIGAYSAAIGPERFGLHPLAALACGVLLSALLAGIAGRPILRLKGHYLAIATLGFGFIVALVLQTESDITGGPDGMQAAKLTIGSWRITSAADWYWVSAGAMLLGAFFAINIAASPTGRALRALHDSEPAAAGAGVDVARYKLMAFIVAAIYAAIAGGMLAMMNRFVTPEIATFTRSVELVAMVIIGGLGSVLGAAAGAAFLTILPQALTSFQEYEAAVLGLLIMVFMIFLPQGIVPSLARAFKERRR
jgi:branched-chain amino acid transport system permease protein